MKKIYSINIHVCNLPKNISVFPKQGILLECPECGKVWKLINNSWQSTEERAIYKISDMEKNPYKILAERIKHN